MERKKSKHRYYCIDPEIGLAAAILRVAAIDYEKALRRQMEEQESLEINKAVRRLEKFFLSDWGQLLSDSHGEIIIEKCRNNVYEGGTAI
jgi:hypothetical protein